VVFADGGFSPFPISNAPDQNWLRLEARRWFEATDIATHASFVSATHKRRHQGMSGSSIIKPREYPDPNVPLEHFGSPAPQGPPSRGISLRPSSHCSPCPMPPHCLIRRCP